MIIINCIYSISVQFSLYTQVVLFFESFRLPRGTAATVRINVTVTRHMSCHNTNQCDVTSWKLRNIPFDTFVLDLVGLDWYKKIKKLVSVKKKSEISDMAVVVFDKNYARRARIFVRYFHACDMCWFLKFTWSVLTICSDYFLVLPLVNAYRIFAPLTIRTSYPVDHKRLPLIWYQNITRHYHFSQLHPSHFELYAGASMKLKIWVNKYNYYTLQFSYVDTSLGYIHIFQCIDNKISVLQNIGVISSPLLTKRLLLTSQSFWSTLRCSIKLCACFYWFAILAITFTVELVDVRAKYSRRKNFIKWLKFRRIRNK